VRKKFQHKIDNLENKLHHFGAFAKILFSWHAPHIKCKTWILLQR